MGHNYMPELLLIKGILDGAVLYKKLPKFLRDDIEMYSDAWGDNTLTETRERVNQMINDARNKYE
jgi:hypothetical protein